MKKSTVIFSLLIAGSVLLSSCTKNLKDDIKDLQQQVGEIENILGSNEPIKVTTTFVDDNDSTRTISEVYSFKAGNNSTQYMTPNGDGTYEVYIERFSDVEWDESVWVEFDYNPTTKAITSKRCGHYWDDMSPYNDYAYYSDGYSPAPTINITVNSINMATGDISLSFSATGDAAYTNAYAWAAPNAGQSVSTNFTFAGKLKIYTTN